MGELHSRALAPDAAILDCFAQERVIHRERVIKPLAVFLAVAGCLSAAACGSGGSSTSDTPEAATPKGPVARGSHEALPRITALVITVVDGDTHRRVPGARVRVGVKADQADGRGEAVVRVRRRAPLLVTATAPGYGERTVRMPFQRRRKVTLRVYRPERQWPFFGANLAHTQVHPAIRLRPPFRVAWSRGLGRMIEFPAVVSDGVAYIGNARGTVRAISMTGGKVAWRRDIPGAKMAASPGVVGNDLVVHGIDGYVRVLDKRNGRVRWTLRVGSAIESSPTVRDGVDYFGAWNGRVYALDLRKRRLRWTYRSGYKITATASIAGRTVYIGDYGGRLLALTAGSGRLRWSRTVNGRIYGNAAIAGRRIFVPSSTGNSMSAFTLGGRFLWRVRHGGYGYSSPAVRGGRVLFGSYDGRLYCVNAATGRVIWSVSAGGRISGAVVVVAGIAYAGTLANRIIGVDPRNGRVVFRFGHGGYVPVSGNARRLLLHGWSRIYAVAPKR